MTLSLRLFFILCLFLAFSWGCTPAPKTSILSGPSEEKNTGIIQGVPVQSKDPGQNSVVMLLGIQEFTAANKMIPFEVCTGVLIAENIALTAAHCIKPLEYQVGLFHDGITQDLGLMGFAAAPSEKRRITKFIVHEKYQGSKWVKAEGGYIMENSNDLALVYFEGSRPKGAELAEIAEFPNSSINNKYNLQLYGYGYTAFDPEALENFAAEIALGRDHFLHTRPLLTAKSVGEVLPENKYGLTIDQRGKPGICYGDSGGPAFVTLNDKTFLAGINSHRTGLYKDRYGEEPLENITNTCQYKAVLTRPDLYLNWINSNKEILQSSRCELLPFFKKRAADLLHLDPTTVILSPQENGTSTLVTGTNFQNKQKWITTLSPASNCRITSNQGLLALNKDSGNLKSLKIKNLLAKLNNPEMKNKKTLLLNTRGQEISESLAETLLTSVAAQEKQSLLPGGWIFEKIHSQDGILTTSSGYTPLDEMKFQANQESFSNGLKQGLSLYWAVVTLPDGMNYRQEIWIQDSETHEALLVRETVTAD